jgi:hypothetical protein
MKNHNLKKQSKMPVGFLQIKLNIKKREGGLKKRLKIKNHKKRLKNRNHPHSIRKFQITALQFLNLRNKNQPKTTHRSSRKKRLNLRSTRWWLLNHKGRSLWLSPVYKVSRSTEALFLQFSHIFSSLSLCPPTSQSK